MTVILHGIEILRQARLLNHHPPIHTGVKTTSTLLELPHAELLTPVQEMMIGQRYDTIQIYDMTLIQLHLPK